MRVRCDRRSFVYVEYTDGTRKKQTAGVDRIGIAQIIEIRSCAPPEQVLIVVRWLHTIGDVQDKTALADLSQCQRLYHVGEEVVLSNHCKIRQYVSRAAYGICLMLSDDVIPVRSVRGPAFVCELEARAFNLQRYGEAGETKTEVRFGVFFLGSPTSAAWLTPFLDCGPMCVSASRE